MSLRLFIAPTAKAEILGIWNYTAAKYGTDAAQDYVSDLDTMMLRLLDYPLLGEDCSDIRKGYRRIRARDHVIYYIASGSGISVMRLLHPSQNARRRLREKM